MMKEKTYNSIPKLLFCPNCHKHIKNGFNFGGLIAGTINFNCGNCKKGKIIIKGQETVKNNG